MRSGRIPSSKGRGAMRSELTDITEHLELEAIAVVDRGVVTRGQRLVVRNLLLEAKDEIELLRDALYCVKGDRDR